MVTNVRPELSVCTVVRDAAGLPALIQALGEQSAGPESFELILVDATPDGVPVPEHPDVDVVAHRAAPEEPDAALLDKAWRSAQAPGVAFLAEHLLPAPLWVEAMQRQLRRGRRVVVGSWIPAAAAAKASGAVSQQLWAGAGELTVATTDQLACRVADLEEIGGVPDLDDPGERGTELAARLVDAGADRSWARHAVVFHPVERTPVVETLRTRRRRMAAMLSRLDDHPRARARLMPAGLVPHRRHVEVLLLAAGVLAARRDRRALVLATPWLHERMCLTPRAGGLRRRWLILPGVLMVDLHDAVTGVLARIRPPHPGP